MPASLGELGFPPGIRVAHAFNVLFLTLLVRSGIEILGGHPMLYFNDHCRPGSEWIRFTSKRMFRNQRWTAEDEKQPYTPWLALPGRDNLGLGRFWHFVAVVGWLLTGLSYVLVLMTSGQWQRLVPAQARYILFRTFDEKWEEPGHGEYYTVIDLDLARAPQTLLAYAMNGQPLTAAFGAPLRLRLETQLGYKMVKYVRSMELVAAYDDIGAGCGGWRADQQHYGRLAPI
jgi:hypothetical protein